MAQLLMPKATAVWLVENTTLTFQQIADFSGLHLLEVQGIADGEVAVGIVGLDPTANGQLTREEVARCEADAEGNLVLRQAEVPDVPRRKGPRYTPVSKRGERPDAISWLLKYTPELSDAQICKLVGTTKPTIEAVRTRSHWNISNIQPRDPVLLGICSQTDLEEHLVKARKRRPEAVVPPPPPPPEPELETKPKEALDAETLFKSSDAVA
ncbi:MAG: DUF1013 domain-containing protein [Alphaproteobacteria bacterium]|nr:DUF1013 domain-containing protein [Alphaproteobacteria bacterium]